MPPEGPDLVLATNIPNRKTDILEFYSLNIKTLEQEKYIHIFSEPM